MDCPPDLTLDSLDRDRAELRVRSDGGAKGAKTRRLPITPKLAPAMKRYMSLHRPEFRVHAHAFRHPFATVATQGGWNLEWLRVAMGHSDYAVLQRYVEMSMQRDLGPIEEWRELIVLPPNVVSDDRGRYH